MELSMIIPVQTVDEQNSCRLTFQLVDPDGVGVGVSAISTATLTLRNEETSATINAVDRNVKASFDSSGNFSYVLSASDNTLISTQSNRQFEDHIAVITIVFSVGTEVHQIKKNFRIRVNNCRFTS